MNDTTAETRVERDDEQQPRSGTRTITGHLFRVRDGKGWGSSDQAPEPPPDPVYRPARVAQMLALAHRLEAAIAAGEYQGRADVARQLGFTRARITQLLDLTLLASDIQEAVLELEAIDGVEPLSERALREVLRHRAWADQRQAWAKLPRKSGAHATVPLFVYMASAIAAARSSSASSVVSTSSACRRRSDQRWRSAL